MELNNPHIESDDDESKLYMSMEGLKKSKEIYVNPIIEQAAAKRALKQKHKTGSKKWKTTMDETEVKKDLEDEEDDYEEDDDDEDDDGDDAFVPEEPEEC